MRMYRFLNFYSVLWWWCLLCAVAWIRLFVMSNSSWPIILKHFLCVNWASHPRNVLMIHLEAWACITLSKRGRAHFFMYLQPGLRLLHYSSVHLPLGFLHLHEFGRSIHCQLLFWVIVYTFLVHFRCLIREILIFSSWVSERALFVIFVYKVFILVGRSLIV